MIIIIFTTGFLLGLIVGFLVGVLGQLQVLDDYVASGFMVRKKKCYKITEYEAK